MTDPIQMWEHEKILILICNDLNDQLKIWNNTATSCVYFFMLWIGQNRRLFKQEIINRIDDWRRPKPRRIKVRHMSDYVDGCVCATNLMAMISVAWRWTERWIGRCSGERCSLAESAASLCTLCMFSRFLPREETLKLAVGVSASADGCLSSYVGPVINRLLVQGVTSAFAQRQLGYASAPMWPWAQEEVVIEQLDVCSRPVVWCIESVCMFTHLQSKTASK